MKNEKKIMTQLEWNLERDKMAMEYEQKKKMEEKTCQYSGLPSVESYGDDFWEKYNELTKGLH